jgi:S1-C subfamily serine protease
MLKALLLALVVTLSLSAESVKPPDAVVRIVVEEKQGGPACGSGALILDRRTVVTNYHVVKDAKSIRILFPSWDVFNCTLVKKSKSLDLAVLRMTRPASVSPLPLGSKPKTGDVLTIWGYGHGIPGSDSGRMTDTNFVDAWLIELKAVARQGDSGGPILNSKGEYVGTLSASDNKITVGTHVDAVRHYIGAKKSGKKRRLY